MMLRFALANNPLWADVLTRSLLQGKAKHSQWEKVKDLSPEEAQKKYVEAVKKLIAKYN